ncbi:hypothetical protein BASA50_009343 [Batrachochytrium salamandrivorans]|uniref:Organic hydroperoxide resistance protein n=1 Tax=Batrachochytrium salamandrivorans TaxID=1357716 RepID=A0ABQ8F1E8_9FUNG|nr:hypothetical protein BASA60_008865 [Batrachochytrium salamandrivorans]KAH6570751.1 hypothetical protein BASA62_004166 [Batrachochytrium salamandrivorans]KAH6590368.1 hypothetical protein BASA50_009343 [Batrachochytrium salamandrivorans]KAH9255009.1 hypothetical protein BASA81_006954 [Batrachochytrium salamandrivorans]
MLHRTASILATSSIRAVRVSSIQPLRLIAPVRTLTFKPLYTAEATATGGRNGTVKTPDGLLDLELSLPKGLGGPGGEKSNPEQLFAAGYSACFLGALGRVASLSSVQLPKETTVKGVVHIGRHEGALLLEVELKVHAPDFDKTQLMTLIESAHQMCPYSNATRGNVKVHLSVV